MVLFGKIREDAARPNGSRSDYRQDFRSMKRSNLRGDDFRITSETIHMEVKATYRSLSMDLKVGEREPGRDEVAFHAG